MLEPNFDAVKDILENQPNYFGLRKNLRQAERDYEQSLVSRENTSSFFDDAMKKLKE